MAYTWQDISQTGYKSGTRQYQYDTNDSHAVVSASGYFNAAVSDSQLGKGDHIEATCNRDTTPVRRSYIVTSVADGVVTVAQLTVS